MWLCRFLSVMKRGDCYSLTKCYAQPTGLDRGLERPCCRVLNARFASRRAAPIVWFRPIAFVKSVACRFFTSSTSMKSYSERSGRLPSFEVVYRFLSTDDGGRNSPPHQHTRWDFLYEGDDPSADGIWMIWPECIAPDGQVLPEGVVPSSGRAFMYLVNLDNEPYHRNRIVIGTKGAFVEGAKQVAVCEVVAILALANASQ